MANARTLVEPTTAATPPGHIPVEDPTTGAVIADVPVVGAEEVRELAAKARAAQPAWAALGFAGRADVFDRSRKWLLANDDRVIGTICSETGKTYEDAAVELNVAVQSFAFWAKRAEGYLADEPIKGFSPMLVGKSVVVRYEAVGLVGVIGPWNFPLVNAFCDAVPALMAGNAAILKPSEHTPLTALLVLEMLRDCGMPEHVFAVATGAGETGASVVDVSDYVMFTGSAATGQKVMERAAKTLTPVSLELGGKDPMIVCADADLERAANAAVFYGLYNSGQVCMSVERVYVDAQVHDAFVDKVVDKVKELRQGPVDGGPGTVEIGAMTFPPQMDVVEAHMDDARAKGAKVLTGGRRRQGAGRFYEPTVLVDVDHSMACMREETFGPTLPIMKFTSEEEAVRLANDSEYGLQGSVFAKDLKRGEAIARQLEVGGVCVNDALTNYSAFGAPMGGWKSSGVGTRHGATGIRKYCRTQTVLVAKVAMKKEAFMFPYSPFRSKLMGRMTKVLFGR